MQDFVVDRKAGIMARSRNVTHVFVGGGGREEIGSAKWCSTNALILLMLFASFYVILFSFGMLDFLIPGP